MKGQEMPASSLRLGAAALLAATLVLVTRPALAGCHHFSVAVSPSTATEGGTVTVTVSRDAALAPSQVDVSTVDETAKAGKDYAALDRTVSFTDDTERTFSVSTTDDTADESAETFRVHLSNPEGCAVNTNYIVDPDVRVTIRDNDPASSPATPPPATEESPSAPASPTQTPSEVTSPTPTETGLAAARDTGGGTPVGAVVGIILGAALAIGVAVLGFLRWRRSGAPA